MPEAQADRVVGVGGRQPLVLWLSVVSEIEGLAFIALGVLLRRADLFLDSQSALLPAAIFVATAAALVAVWAPRRHPTRDTEIPVAETELVADLAQRIGVGQPRPATPATVTAAQPEAAWRRALQRH